MLIVGGGITGASLLYTLSGYTDIRKIALIEKYDDFALLNSNTRNNAQTLHFGDIETNYTEKNARHIKSAAEMLLRYTSSIPSKERDRVIAQCQKMVLGIGEEEIESLESLYSSWLKRLFPGIRKIGANLLEKLEPKVMEGRPHSEKVMALLSDKGYMVNFGELTHSFIRSAKKLGKDRVSISLGNEVLGISRSKDGFEIRSRRGVHAARFVVFATGAYSLFFAKSMGYERNLSVLSVGGNFYTCPKVLNGKVYRVQKGGIPFAAIHGDPDIANPKITRFGPTVTIPLQLERHNNSTTLDYMRTFDFDFKTMSTLKNVLLNKDISRIIRRNILYMTPLLGKYEFLKKEAGRIVPSLKYSDLTFQKHMGGIRPQVIDENKGSLIVGGAKIDEGGLIFNITPSPGASSCLDSSLSDALKISEYLGIRFNGAEHAKRLGAVKA